MKNIFHHVEFSGVFTTIPLLFGALMFPSLKRFSRRLHLIKHVSNINASFVCNERATSTKITRNFAIREL